MKKKLLTVFLISIMTASMSYADFAFTEPSDFTGEAFFTPPSDNKQDVSKSEKKERHTTPPLKKLRLTIQEKLHKKELQKYELAPTAQDIYTGEIETSEYASKETEDNFENMAPDGFESDEGILSEEEQPKKIFKRKKNKVKNEDSENIILDCEKVDYDTENYLVFAKGNVSVHFVKQDIVVKSDTITFDRINNTIKAEGNVRILKHGHVVTGDYIFVDMNEENALIENPITKSTNIEIKSQKGYVYGDRIVQENGSLEVNDSFPINFQSAKRGPQLQRMMFPKNETMTDDMEKGLIKLQAKDIKITQKGDLETIEFTKPRLFKGKRLIFKTPSIKFYTNKNHDYVEMNHWEIGAYRGLGVYAGPGFVFELPKGSVLKAMPILNYKSGFGVGALGRFSSGTNHTMAAYGTAKSKIMVLGEQRLDDNLTLHYGMNSYMPEWFLGRRRPKYGIGLAYDKSYVTRNFLVKNQEAGYRHRFDAGYYHDLDFDNSFEKIKGTEMGTTRFRYMAEARQNLFSYKNEEELKALTFGIAGQLSTAVYGTGDTQVIGRVGPRLHTQYKRWMQDIGYFFSAYDDNTPMPVFDAYRYATQNLYLREYFRINKFLTISWFGSINVSGDAPNGKDLQECSFYFSVGPEDLKLNLGYDFIRENLYCTFLVMMDAKGTKIDYETLEIKQDKKAQKDNSVKQENSFETANTTGEKVLKKAVVENIKVVEDVL